MTPLPQQLEDKKKELTDLESRLNRLNFHLSMKPKSNACKKLIKDIMFDIEKVKAEIAILEQAITEMQKQRQEILEDELKFLNLGKIKIEGKTKDMEFLIRKRIQYLKQQLNQPKTEKENSKDG